MGCIWYLLAPIFTLGSALLIFGLFTQKVDAIKFGAILAFLGLVAFFQSTWIISETNPVDENLQDEIDRNQ